MFRSSCLAALAVVCCTSFANADERPKVSSQILVAANRDGLGNVLMSTIGARYAPGNEPISIARANGATDWDYINTAGHTVHGPSNWLIPYGSDPIMGNGEPVPPGYSTETASFAEAATWVDSNMRGIWQYDWADGSTLNFDPTSAYISPTDLILPELTAASVEQFYNIRDQGLTGAFTFELASPASADGTYGFNVYSRTPGSLGPGWIAGESFSDGSFTVDVLEALSFDAQLEVTMGVSSNEPEVYVATAANVRYGMDYSIPAVPGVGGVAALAGLGLIGRRRRR